jgi:two-component system, cell cycle sensor histidine kinase and response regulator CckA
MCTGDWVMEPSEVGKLVEENQRLKDQIAELQQTLQQTTGDKTSDTEVERPSLEWIPKELGARRALLHEVERTAQMGSWVWDVTTQQVAWSEELYRILGYSPDQDVSTVEAFFDAVHPLDVQRVREASARSTATGIAESIDFRILRKDGSIREVTMNGAMIVDAQGTLRRIVGTVLDITDNNHRTRELKRSSEVLQEAQRMAKVGSWQWDSEGDSLVWSDQLYEILGADRKKRPSFFTFFSHIHPDDRTLVQEYFEYAKREDRMAHSIEFRIVRANDSLVYVSARIKPTIGEAGELLALMGIVHDISDRRQLEQRLIQTQKMEAIGRVTGGISHDFNNFLTVIYANAQLLMLHQPNPKLLEITLAAEKAADLTKRLLSFTRHSTEQLQAIDIHEVIQSTLGFIEKLLDKRGILTFHLGEQIWPIWASGNQVQLILMNLMTNARDALPESGGSIEVRTQNIELRSPQTHLHPETKAGNYVELSIKDSGRGMDEKTRLRIYEPFFTTKESGKGTGLGLATVFGLMKQFGGWIDCDSELNRGTTFRLYFRKADLYREKEDLNPQSTSWDNKQGNILVVEDDPAIGRTINDILKTAGHHVWLAANVAQANALFAIHQTDIDLVVSDIMLPDGDGRVVCDKFRKQRPELPILFMTGYSPGAFQSQGESFPYLLKPFGPETLLSNIEKLLPIPSQLPGLDQETAPHHTEATGGG